MKLYNKLRKLDKRTKVGLVSSAICSAMYLAIPAFANQVTEKPVVQPLNLDQITTPEQADDVYNTKLKEYAADKKISGDEISSLNRILEKKGSFFDRKMGDLTDEYSEIVTKKRGIEDELEKCQIEIIELKRKKEYTHPDVSEIKDNFYKKVLSHYPSLLEKEANITYSAETKIKPGLVPIFKGMVAEIHGIQIKFYKDDSLEILSQQQEYTLSDLIAFHKALNKERPDICFNGEEIGSKQEMIREKQNKLKEQLDVLVNSKVFNDYHTKFKDIGSERKGSDKVKSRFSNYMEIKRKLDSFSGKDLSKYMGVSLFYLLDYNDKHYHAINSSEGPYDASSEIESLENYFKSNGLEVSVDKLKDPTRTKIPNTALMMILGFALPITRNIFVRKYMGRIPGMDGDDYGLAVGAGIANGFAGAILLDYLHPLVWWFRMVGTPLIIQPIEQLAEKDSGNKKKKRK